VRALRAALDEGGAAVASSQSIAETRRAAEDHLLMVVEFLGGMGWIMILVGGVGLASTMGLAVLERTRELGVLRAIGARHRDLLLLVEAEGLVIGLLAWLLALPLSVPIASLIGSAFGRMMFPVTTPLLPDAGAMLRWLSLVVAIALLASLWPALRALRTPAAVALAYE
jgi:putative ABC transport system permease protein